MPKTRNVILAACLTTAFCVSSQIPTYVPQSGLKGWWPFTGNANDLTTFAHNGTITAATLTNDRFNAPNSAYSFAGNGVIQTNYNGVLGGASRAVSFWAKTSQSSAIMTGVAWGNPYGTASRYEAGFNYGAPGPMIDGGNGVITYSAPSPVFDNHWHHYVVQIVNSSALSQVQIYQDAVLLTTTANVYSGSNVLNTASGYSVAFGRLSGQSFHFFIGDLDDIGIWDRYLTPCEINALYTGIASGSLQVSVAVSNPQCSGAGGSATISTGGSGPFTYTWLPSGGSASVASNLQAGTYTYIASNAANCSQSGTIAIVSPAPLTVGVVGPTTLCAGGVAMMSGSVTGGSGPYNYQWTAGPPTQAYSVNPGAGNYVYTLTVTDQHGCSSMQSHALSVSSPPVVSISGGVKVCRNSAVALTASGASSYYWSTASTSTAITIVVQTSTVISVTGFNAQGCGASTSVAIQPNECLDVNEQSKKTALMIFPVPGREVTVRAAADIAVLRLYDAAGKLVFETYPQACDATLDLASQPAGIYLLSYVVNGVAGTKRIIRE